uniref:procollagen-proline 4-dioxygenase n=1 Tax=Clytia hemisphaerica TaxID=252671 RepID=A0A069DMS4_9CNID
MRIILQILFLVTLLFEIEAKSKSEEYQKPKHDFFTSASDMEVLLNVEKKLSKKFLRYVRKEEERLDKLEGEIRNIEDGWPQPGRSKAQWLSHVTNSYTILKRFSTFWPKIGDFSKSNTTKDYMLRLFSDLSRIKESLPAEEDMKGALNAVFRLQDTYDLPAADFIDGLGGDRAHKLSVEEIFEIGFLCVGINDHYHAHQWLNEALNPFPVGIQQVGFLDRISLLEYLAWSEYHLGHLEQAVNLTAQIVHIDPTHKSAPINLELYQNDLKASQFNPNIRKKVFRREKDWQTRHNNLCNGKEVMEQEIIDKLYCEFDNKRHPRFILKPLKVEHLYNEPGLTMYHDLLRDWEIDAVKEKARPLLKRATVHDPKTGELVFADYRISKSAWLKPEMDQIANHVINKVGDVINLDMRYSESLQVQNYGLAGQYEPHFDHSTVRTPKQFKELGGNRIATMLLYMSEVERGGATIFVNTGPGVAIWPEKGAGVFWYNLLRNGDGDKKTRHAGCPVLVGHKWVSNLWIHEHGQEFRRQCSLNMHE